MNNRHRRFWVLALVLSACTAAPTTSPVPTTAPSTTAPSPSSAAARSSPGPSAPAAPTLAPSASTTAWDEVFSRDNARVGALIVWRGGFLASGCDVEPEDSFCTRNFVLSSADGDTWTMTEMPIPTDFGIRSLHVVGDRLMGLGYGHYFTEDYAGGAIVVTSTDGRTWARVESASFRDRAVDDIIQTPLGTFAVGHEAPIDSDDTSGFLLWPFRDDGSLGKPRVVDMGGDPHLITGASWTGRELLGWGLRHGPWAGPTVVLASADGRSWSKRGTIPGGDETNAAAILVVGDRLIAVGNRRRQYPLAPIAWTSDDGGRTWDRATVEGDDAAMYDVQVEGDRLIARGGVSYAENRRPVSWESMDGSTWTILPADSDLPDILGFSPWTRATHAGRTCVADSISSGETLRAAIFCR